MMETKHVCDVCERHDNVQRYVDDNSGETFWLCPKCAGQRAFITPFSEMRMCFKCEHMVYKTHTWAETDPCTNKTVYICDACYVSNQIARVRVIISMHFMERCTTLEMLEIAHDVYAYRATYHMFDDHVQTEPDIAEFALSWIRDAFHAMNHVYDDLSVCATETYMDCDTCNQ